jgi:UDP-N-acetylmuramoyl-tripeptide--D-alanyl-D-alanine ligase
LVGAYNLPNILLAFTIGRYFKVDTAKIKYAIENYTPSNSRSQLVEKGTNKIILDAYNANPSSMTLAIENIAGLQAQHKALVLGAMAELGTDSIKEHAAIVALIQKYQWRNVVLVGGDFLKISHPYTSFPDAETAAAWFREQDFKNTIILIKGSRSTAMEKVLAG